MKYPEDPHMLHMKSHDFVLNELTGQQLDIKKLEITNFIFKFLKHVKFWRSNE